MTILRDYKKLSFENKYSINRFLIKEKNLKLHGLKVIYTQEIIGVTNNERDKCK